MIKAFFALLKSLFFRPPILQVAALCLRGQGAEIEVLLVRSLDSKRWIIPKGWPMRGKTLAQAAAMEAWEEAGVKGVISAQPIGQFRYLKRRSGGFKQRCVAHVFELQVMSCHESFPESETRKPKWMTPGKAVKKIKDRGLRAIISARCAESLVLDVVSG
ncbi:NUDIX hydrolase [Pseudorhodobacter sp.]|uniref:NUDIX hydrolase n=1 Tax=Pseudorhodobacter sp. TaxID=1934400 RepID=UPI002649AE7D|nr:NUDIX hydrolase [Pseudorhodobacter sp.]MDN5786732.1 NUDIX hydrolase [Pseudorhodobacter sp.]